MRRKTETRKQAIIDVAKAVFDEFGFEAASMSEIAARLGGSKATLYSYFPSKEELFIAVARSFAETHMRSTFGALNPARGLRENLLDFGQRFITLLCSDDIIKSHRYLIGEAGKTSIGRQFYDIGPRVGLAELSGFLRQTMDKGELNAGDPLVAALQLAGLLKAENFELRLLGVKESFSDLEISQMTERAVDVFLRGYSPVR